ncbi:unnamed protein product, partial [Closterium sp. NIES-53]
QALYDAVVARYSSPATAALGRLFLPYLFPVLSAFTMIEDLVSHLRASDARYRAAVPAEFLDRNPPPMGVPPPPLALSYASAATADVSVPEDVGAASASAKCRSSKGKGGRGGGGGSGGGGGGSGSGGGGSSGGGGGGGTVGGSGGSGGGGGGSGGSGGSGGGGTRSDGPGTQRVCSGGDLLKSRIAIFDLDYDAILSVMYGLSVSAEGDCNRCVLADPGIAATALTASESGTLPGTAPAVALHTFTLADPSEGSVVARSSTVLPCPAVPSGSLSGLHLPSISTNLVSTAALQDAMVTTTTPGGSSLYTLATEPPQVAASAQVSLSTSPSWHALSSSCLWPPQVSASPATLACPTLPPLCRGAAARRSSLLLVSPANAHLHTLHMDVWGPARISGQSCERYFLLVVDDYTRYTMVFSLRSKGQVVDVLIPWIRTVRLQLRERFGQDLLVLRLHSNRGGEFSSNLLRDFCRGEGILQSFTLPDSPKKNGIAERRIGLVMEVAHTSMIHAAAPHFLWPFAVRYAAHQLNLWPRVSLPKTSPTLRWMGEVGIASVFRVWGSRAFVHDTSADKLSLRAILCVFLGFVPDAPGWQFYHPTSRHVFPSQDVTFDESVLFYCLFPYRSAPPPPPPLFLAPGPPPVYPLLPQGPAPSGVSQVDPLPGPAPFQGAETGGTEPGGVKTRGAEPGGVATGGAEPEGVEPGCAEPGGAESEGAESGGAEPQGAASSGGSAGASPRLSLQQLCEWFVWRTRRRSGASGGGGAGAAGDGGAGEAARAGVTGGTATTGPGGARTR